MSETLLFFEGFLIVLFLLLGFEYKDKLATLSMTKESSSEVIDAFAELYQMIFVNLALIMIPITLSTLSKTLEGTTYFGLSDTLAAVSVYISGAFVMVNLIVNLWRFVPILWNLTVEAMRNW